jgi:hypothetical protein
MMISSLISHVYVIINEDWDISQKFMGNKISKISWIRGNIKEHEPYDRSLFGDTYESPKYWINNSHSSISLLFYYFRQLFEKLQYTFIPWRFQITFPHYLPIYNNSWSINVIIYSIDIAYIIYPKQGSPLIADHQ